MQKQTLKLLIDTAAGRTPAELVIKNCKVIDVYNAAIIEGDIAVCGGLGMPPKSYTTFIVSKKDIKY
jgi:adenine deaminase